MYKLLLIPSAKKDLDGLPDQVFIKIKAYILGLEKTPRPNGCIKLTGEEGYRIRIGDYRVLYRIDDKAKTVYIYRVKHRRESYR